MNTPFQPPDSADFMNKLWSGWSGSLNLPSMLTPTLNLEEIDRRINELKTVEHWLNVNQNMLRNTIQGLEVQRGTLAALQTFSASLGQAANAATNAAAQEPADNSPPPAQTQFAEAMQQGSAMWWDLLQQQFSHLAKAAVQTPAQSSTQTPAQDPAPKTEASTEAPAKPAARSNKTSRS